MLTKWRNSLLLLSALTAINSLGFAMEAAENIILTSVTPSSGSASGGVGVTGLTRYYEYYVRGYRSYQCECC
jgi:hypothetical protein